MAPELLIDESRRCAYLDGRELQLTPQEYRVLACLARKLDQVVVKQDLLAAMWPSVEREHSAPADLNPVAVDLVICRLRKKLADQVQHPTFLETRRGFGYILHHAHIGVLPAAEQGQTNGHSAWVEQNAGGRNQNLAALTIGDFQPWSTLTRREWDIFMLLGDEQTTRLTNKALAHHTQMAEGTLKKHLKHIYRKLGVENRSAAAILSMQVRVHLLAKGAP